MLEINIDAHQQSAHADAIFLSPDPVTLYSIQTLLFSTLSLDHAVFVTTVLLTIRMIARGCLFLF